MKDSLHMGIEIPNQEAANDDEAEQNDGEKDGEEKFDESVAGARLAREAGLHVANTFCCG